MPMKLSLIDDHDVKSALTIHLRTRRQSAKLSRDKLAQLSSVPAPTIKKFETTGDISLRQFLKLWLSLDDLSRLYTLTKAKPTNILRPLMRCLMKVFEPVRKLLVTRCLSNGQKVSVGRLAQNSTGVYFAYESEYLSRFGNLSPFLLEETPIPQPASNDVFFRATRGFC